jgi:nucleotide-binding universal stress UspA family protein
MFVTLLSSFQAERETQLNEYSLNALDWLLANLLEDGDEVVVLRVLEPPKEGLSFSKAAEEEAKADAMEGLDMLMAKVGNKRSVSLIIELCVGAVQDTIQRMISIYKPDSLVVGTRGRTDYIWRTPFMGSTSRCVGTVPAEPSDARPDTA